MIDEPKQPGPSEPPEPPSGAEPDSPADLAEPETEAPPAEPGDADEPGEADSACAADQAEVAATIEAILFASDKPMPAGRINDVGQLGGARNVRQAIDALNARYEQMGCTFRIREIAGGYQLQTVPEYADVLARLHKSRTESRLSQAAMETLAIIAYRQPALRADIESIRGVSCGEVLHGLMERNLVRIVGRAEEVGRPLLYGTTRQFLEVFGLASLDDLPKVEQLRSGAKPPGLAPAPPPAGPPPAAAAPLPAQAEPQPALQPAGPAADAPPEQASAVPNAGAASTPAADGSEEESPHNPEQPGEN